MSISLRTSSIYTTRAIYKAFEERKCKAAFEITYEIGKLTAGIIASREHYVCDVFFVQPMWLL